MFLHLGGEIIIPTKNIVAILDVDARENSSSTQEFLRMADDEGFVVRIENAAASFVVTSDKVYLSPISALTLRKRIANQES